MIKTPVILGASMASRSHRRTLVAATYAILLALVAAILAAPPLGGRVRSLWLLFLPLAFNVVSHAVFGRMIDPMLPKPAGREATGLGLTLPSRAQDEPDEREMAVRNAAHYHAFRAATVYGLFYWTAIPLYWRLHASAIILLVLLFAIPLLTMLLTLPQAIILWTEPDVPEDGARALPS